MYKKNVELRIMTCNWNAYLAQERGVRYFTNKACFQPVWFCTMFLMTSNYICALRSLSTPIINLD